jgi:Asp-tRNA(Asn)/Glu-tRNA(Gln) amidotransferase A subunit family amidase
VATGLVPAALGTDGGGSIRRPACHTGLVGFKPSIGRWPRIDGFPAILTDFETAGTLTRTVDDALLLDERLRGPDVRDRRSLYAPAPRWPVGKARILYVPASATRRSIPTSPKKSNASPACSKRKGTKWRKPPSFSILRRPRSSGASSLGLGSPG